jgi:hypothetical protein
MTIQQFIEKAIKVSEPSWEQRFVKFCKERNWIPTNMGVEIDHYKAFISSLLAEQREQMIGLVEEKMKQIAQVENADDALEAMKRQAYGSPRPPAAALLRAIGEVYALNDIRKEVSQMV